MYRINWAGPVAADLNQGGPIEIEVTVGIGYRSIGDLPRGKKAEMK